MKCIYCQEREADSEEHLLPRGLGRFPAPFLPARGVLCHECNVRYGNDLITPLLRKGFYSQARRRIPWKVGRPTKKKRPQGAGYDMPFADLPNVEGKILVDFDLGRQTARAARQLVFKEADGSMTPWLVPDYIRTSEALAAAIKRSGHKGKLLEACWFGPNDNLPDLLRELYPHAPIEFRDPMDEGQAFAAERNYEVTVEQRRAIVMVAFHLFLAIYRPRGDEPQFRVVRRFIAGDGQEWGPLSVVNPDEPTRSPFGPIHDAMPDRPKHIFGFGKAGPGQVVAGLRLFANEDTSTWWQVLLASGESGPVQPSFGALVYYEDAPHEIEGRVMDGYVITPRREHGEWVLGGDGG